MKKLAVIDVGSNTTRMVVVNLYDNGSYRIVDELKEPVRLISDMTQDNIIRPRRIQQLIKTLQMFKRLCTANETTDIIPVLTAAVRRAANQRSLLDEVYAATGINLTLLTGEQEAIYVYQGVINTMDIDAGVIMDIGGGTVELVHFEKRQVKNLAHLLQDGGKLPLFAKELHPKLLQGGRGGCGVQSSQGAALDVFQLLFHCDPSPLLKARRLLVLIGMAHWGKNKKASVPMGTKEIPPRYHPQFAKRRTL